MEKESKRESNRQNKKKYERTYAGEKMLHNGKGNNKPKSVKVTP